jgi:hypothetical protein
MKKATVYLPDDLKAGLQEAAREAGKSESKLIREAVRNVVVRSVSQIGPRPKIPLFTSQDPELAERVDEYLRGFGER